MKRPLRREKEGGFSLVELMVVVIVLAILAATIIPQCSGATHDAKVSAAKGHIATLTNALEYFNTRFDRYPTTEEGLRALVYGPKEDKRAKDFQPLIKELIDDPWGNPYQYRSPGEHGSKTYDVWSMGADGKSGGDGKDQDVVSWKEETPNG